MGKKILIVMGDNTLSTIIDLGIRQVYDFEVVKMFNMRKVMKLLEEDQNFDCIIADDSDPSGSATRIAMKSREFDRTIPVISLVETKDVTKNSSNVRFYASFEKPDVLDSVNTILEQFSVKRVDTPTYLSMDLNTLLNFNSLGCDCYIKMSDKKYLKVLKSGDYFGKDDFDKYRAKGVEEFFLDWDDVEPLIERLSENFNSLKDLSDNVSISSLGKIGKTFSDEESKQAIDNIVSALERAEDNSLAFEDGISVCSNTMNTIQKTMSKFGASSGVQQLTKATVLLSISTIKQSPQLSQLFEKIEDCDSDTYIRNHSVLLANISCNIAKLLGWNSNLTFYKLTLASLLHDITLEDGRIASFRTIPDLMLKADEFEEEQLESFLKHTENAAKLVRDFRMIPPDVDMIVSQHHERPDGTGFPEKLGYNEICPLACVLIVAHDLVSYILSRSDREKDKWNMVSFLNRYRMLYHGGVFKDIFGAMWSTMVHSSRPE